MTPRPVARHIRRTRLATLARHIARMAHAVEVAADAATVRERQALTLRIHTLSLRARELSDYNRNTKIAQ